MKISRTCTEVSGQRGLDTSDTLFRIIFPSFTPITNYSKGARDSLALKAWISQNVRFLGHCRNLRFTIGPIHAYRLENHVIRTIDVNDEDICQLQCYMEPNCVSYNFNKKEAANGQHKCDLNSATYEHDNEHSGDLAKNENYVYRGAEVSIQLPLVRSTQRWACSRARLVHIV